MKNSTCHDCFIKKSGAQLNVEKTKEVGVIGTEKENYDSLFVFVDDVLLQESLLDEGHAVVRQTK